MVRTVSMLPAATEIVGALGLMGDLAAALPSQPRVLNLEPRSLRDILRCVRDVATAMGRADRATDVCRGLEERIGAVVRRVGGILRPTTFVMEWADPIFNAGHWTP